MARSRICVLAFVLAGTLLSVPSVGTAQVADRAAPGDQKFILIQSDETSNEGGGPIAALGPIHAHGTDVVLSDFKDRFEFPDGNVVIKHKPKGEPKESFDPIACIFTFVEKGTWETVKGTGAYANVQGSGTYKVTGGGIGCEENQPPESFYIHIVAKGPLTY